MIDLAPKTYSAVSACTAAERGIVDAFNAALSSLRSRRPDVARVQWMPGCEHGGVLLLDGAEVATAGGPTAAMQSYLRR
jgi:hypothetical protein